MRRWIRICVLPLMKGDSQKILLPVSHFLMQLLTSEGMHDIYKPTNL